MTQSKFFHTISQHKSFEQTEQNRLPCSSSQLNDASSCVMWSLQFGTKLSQQQRPQVKIINNKHISISYILHNYHLTAEDRSIVFPTTNPQISNVDWAKREQCVKCTNPCLIHCCNKQPPMFCTLYSARSKHRNLHQSTSCDDPQEEPFCSMAGPNRKNCFSQS